MNRLDLPGILRKRGLSVSEDMESRFDWEAVAAFSAFLEEFNERGGFFSKGDAERILERHLYECLVFVDYVARRAPVSRETEVCDAGSGPGLPGYLFSCLHNAPRLTLTDSSRRRLGLVEVFHGKRAGAPRIEFAYERLEESRKQFDVITLRALIPFPFSVEIITRLQKIGGQAFLSLGQPPEPGDLTYLGYVSRETYIPAELAALGARSFLHLVKTRKQDSLYPRPWKIIQEEIRTCRESMQ